MSRAARALMLLTLLLAGSVGAAHAEVREVEPVERVVRKQYVGAPTSAGLVFCGAPRTGADGVGRVCYGLLGHENQLSVELDDLGGGPVAGRVVFFGVETGPGEPPDVRGTVSFCGTAAAIAVPPSSTHLDVEIGDRPEWTERPCGTLTSGTIGIATARFRA